MQIMLHAMQLIIILWKCMYVYETLLGVIWRGGSEEAQYYSPLYLSVEKNSRETKWQIRSNLLEQNACEVYKWAGEKHHPLKTYWDIVL